MENSFTSCDTMGMMDAKTGDLAKGEKARGNVAFEVKTAAKGLVLECKPLIVGAADAIRVALE